MITKFIVKTMQLISIVQKNGLRELIEYLEIFVKSLIKINLVKNLKLNSTGKIIRK